MSDGGVGTEVGSGSGSSTTTGTGASDAGANGANADGTATAGTVGAATAAAAGAGAGAGGSCIDEDVVARPAGPVLTSVDADDPVATAGTWLATRVGSALSEAGVCANFCCCSNACARA